MTSSPPQHGPDAQLQARALDWLDEPCAVLDASLRYQLVSPAWARELGARPEALLGASLSEGQPAHARCLEAMREELSASGLARRRLGRETQGGASGGRGRDLECRAVALPSGAPGYFLRLREPAPELGHVQKLEVVGQLAASVAHNFNNLLSVVLTNVEVTLAALPDRSALRGLLEDVRTAAQRGEGLTRQLLAFGRKQTFDLRPVEADAVVETAVAALRVAVSEQVTCEVSLGAPGVVVRADPGQLAQALINLGLNARDAMPRGGRLTVATRVVDLGPGATPPGLPPGEYVEMTVRDTGVGMSEEVARRAFEPFFTTKDEAQGTGLGLPSARDIVAHHGGAIVAESAPGAGATFRLFLPRARAALPPAGDARATAAKRRPRQTVLLVEDEDMVRAATRRVLEISGFAVLTAANGAEALAICERAEQPIDLLLTDIVMPGMNGRELARRVRALRPAIPTVFISGYDAAAASEPGDADGVLLQKPVDPAQLVATLRSALGT